MYRLLFLFLIVVSCSTEAQVEEQGPINKVVAKAEFKELMNKEGVQLIDVRTDQECHLGMIEGAKQIDWFDPNFEAEIKKLDMNKPVLIYCRSGNRSGQASKKMIELGFQEIYDLKGGYMGWE